MDPIQAIILGFIQGVTEWLPISSSGHLRFTELLLELRLPLLFDVTLHLGTLAVILIFFRKDIKSILSALVKRDFNSENGKLIPLIIIGTIPTALVGLAFNNAITEYFSSFFPIATAFLAGGVILYLSKNGQERSDKITYLNSFVIGIAQGVALIPGMSRSGLTIAIALLLGIKRKKAFKFSFLLSIPAVLGALGLTLIEEFETLTVIGIDWKDIFLGIAVSMIVGYFALKLLWKALAGRKFHLFALYCWLIGALLLILSLGAF
jgi:undecaprenyl-diphosphatase